MSGTTKTRKKRSKGPKESPAQKKAEVRYAAIIGFDPKLDLGNNLNMTSYNKAIVAVKGNVTLINDLQTKLAAEKESLFTND